MNSNKCRFPSPDGFRLNKRRDVVNALEAERQIKQEYRC